VFYVFLGKTKQHVWKFLHYRILGPTPYCSSRAKERSGIGNLLFITSILCGDQSQSSGLVLEFVCMWGKRHPQGSRSDGGSFAGSDWRETMSNRASSDRQLGASPPATGRSS
jgi:hypothetical protein